MIQPVSFRQNPYPQSISPVRTSQKTEQESNTPKILLALGGLALLGVGAVWIYKSRKAKIDPEKAAENIAKGAAKKSDPKNPQKSTEKPVFERLQTAFSSKERSKEPIPDTIMIVSKKQEDTAKELKNIVEATNANLFDIRPDDILFRFLNSSIGKISTTFQKSGFKPLQWYGKTLEKFMLEYNYILLHNNIIDAEEAARKHYNKTGVRSVCFLGELPFSYGKSPANLPRKLAEDFSTLVKGCAKNKPMTIIYTVPEENKVHPSIEKAVATEYKIVSEKNKK